MRSGVAENPPYGVTEIFQDLDIHKYVFTPKKSLSLVGQIFFLAM